MKFTFKIGSKIKEAWVLYKEHLKAFLLLTLVTLLVSFLRQDEGVILFIIIYIFNILFSYIWIRSTIELIDKKTFNPFSKEIFPSFLQFWNFIKTIFLSALCILAGFILFIIPGFYVAGRLIFSSYISAEKNQGARKTIKEAWNSTKGYGWKLFWKSFIIGLIIIVGFIALFFGVFITYPIGMILLSMLYREFSRIKPIEIKEEDKIAEVVNVVISEEIK